MTIDPLVGLTGQPYAYTGDDPLNAIDPEGQFPCLSLHCIANDVSVVASVVSAAAGVLAFIPVIGPAFEAISVTAGAVALAADVANCIDGHCDGVQLTLDLVALIPGSAALKLENQAGGIDKLAKQLVDQGADSSVVKELENNSGFKRLVSKSLDLNATGVGAAGAVTAVASGAGAVTVFPC